MVSNVAAVAFLVSVCRSVALIFFSFLCFRCEHFAWISEFGSTSFLNFSISGDGSLPIAHPLAPRRRLGQVSLHQGRRSLLEIWLLVLRAENAQPSVDRNRRRYDPDTGVGRRSRVQSQS